MCESQMDWVWAWDTQCWCPVSCLILYPWAVPTLTGWPPVCSDSGLTNVNRTVSRWCSGLLWPFLQWEGVTASVHQVIRVKAGAANPGVLGAQLPPGWSFHLSMTAHARTQWLRGKRITESSQPLDQMLWLGLKPSTIQLSQHPYSRSLFPSLLLDLLYSGENTHLRVWKLRPLLVKEEILEKKEKWDDKWGDKSTSKKPAGKAMIWKMRAQVQPTQQNQHLHSTAENLYTT